MQIKHECANILSSVKDLAILYTWQSVWQTDGH